MRKPHAKCHWVRLIARGPGQRNRLARRHTARQEESVGVGSQHPPKTILVLQCHPASFAGHVPAEGEGVGRLLGSGPSQEVMAAWIRGRRWAWQGVDKFEKCLSEDSGLLPFSEVENPGVRLGPGADQEFSLYTFKTEVPSSHSVGDFTAGVKSIAWELRGEF